jgi:hypothetical protein
MRFENMTLRQIFVTSFLHGISAPLQVFDRVQRPGSDAAALATLSTSVAFSAYGEVSTSMVHSLIELREAEIRRNAIYSTCVRIIGFLSWLALIGGIVLLIAWKD